MSIRNLMRWQIIRWQVFPWDKWLDTSLAWGIGLSYAKEKPQMEIQESENVSNLLLYMNAELDVILPAQRDWSVFTRIHHRSGIFGVINNVDGGVDAVVFGIKRRF